MIGVRGLGWGGWSGDGGDGIGFERYQVRGLGSGRSKELGGWGRRSLGQEVELKSRRLVGLDSEVGVGVREVGVRSWVGEVGVGGIGVRGASWDQESWGQKN